MNRFRRAILQYARPQNREELELLLPDASFEPVGDRHELVVYTGWRWSTSDRAAFRPMKEDA